MHATYNLQYITVKKIAEVPIIDHGERRTYYASETDAETFPQESEKVIKTNVIHMCSLSFP